MSGELDHQTQIPESSERTMTIEHTKEYAYRHVIRVGALAVNFAIWGAVIAWWMR
jgi:hypothetical protein